MTKTEHYHLNQWEPADRVLREDFNRDNEKIDAALNAKGDCSITSGFYMGTGKYGPAYPNRLYLGFQPRLLLILHNDEWAIFYPMHTKAFVHSFSSATVNVDWKADGLTWCVLDSSSIYKAAMQLNTDGEKYHYIAFQ